jgi:hypothetical protein
MIAKRGLWAFLRLLRIAPLMHVLRTVPFGGNTDVDRRLASQACLAAAFNGISLKVNSSGTTN